MTYPDVGAAIRALLIADSSVTTLVGTSPPKVFPHQAPAWVDNLGGLPYILYYSAGGGLMNLQNRNSLNLLFRVESRADKDDSTSARGRTMTLHQAVFGALHKQSLTLTGWTNYWLMCSSHMEFLEQPKDGNQYYRMVWDIEIKASEDT